MRLILAERVDALGWHWDGVVAVCAWERQHVLDWDTDFVNDHVEILKRLGVACDPDEEDPKRTRCHFNEASIKGFQLMHILLHELGHHHDRMTTKSQDQSSRGESFAETYALKYADRLWDAYFEEFNW